MSPPFILVGLLAAESKFQHLAPTVRATTRPPAMAPKRANPKADEAAKAALLSALERLDEQSYCHLVQKPCLRCYTPSLDQFASESKFQHLAPTVCATKKPPAMTPKKASSKADEAAKAALLAAKKGKALALTHSTHQEATEDDGLRTCVPEGQPQPPPGFAPPEGADATEDGEVIGVSAEEQLQLRALRIKNLNLQKQKEILEAKRQRVSSQAKVRQMIRDEEQKA